MLRFNAIDYNVFHTPLLPRPPRLAERLTNFFGVFGTANIVSHQSWREITCNVWFTHYQAYTVSDLIREIQKLDDEVGAYAQLKEINDQVNGFPGNPQTFDFCKFVGFFPKAIEGQVVPEPVYDPHGFFDPPAKQALWIQYGALRWVQLIQTRVSP